MSVVTWEVQSENVKQSAASNGSSVCAELAASPAAAVLLQVGKLLGEEWKALSAEDKAQYEAQAAKDKERYAAAMSEYKASGAAAAAAAGEAGEGDEAGGDDEEEAAEL
jgi:hypothetical protein